MSSSKPTVRKFYKDKTIFITGASGFMGKVLVEKLLYSCSDLKSIYVLLRPKRGKVPKSRVDDMFKLPVSIKKNIFLMNYLMHFCLFLV